MARQDDTPAHLRRPYMPFLDEVPAESANRQCSVPGCTCQESAPLQQDFSLKPFYDDLTKGGLAYAYAKYNDLNPQQYYHKQTSHPKHVIVIGAGMSGLSAAYELEQAGHEVTILERQHRSGGRAKTIRKFAHGLHAEGGAMRLPTSHFLTKHYIDLFKVKTRPFQNYNKNGYLSFYDGPKVKVSDWEKDPGWYCNKYWKGWDANLHESVKSDLAITGIESYFNCTVAPVIEELRMDHSPAGWERWVEKWSKFSVTEFLQSDMHQNPSDKYKLRPWPDKAIEAYRVKLYMPLMGASLVEYLRELVGDWWQDRLQGRHHLYTPVEGMESLAWAFTAQNEYGWNPKVRLSKNIRYGVKVERIEEVTEANGEKLVKVTGRNTASKEIVTYTGDAVIVTVPLTVLRQMTIPLSLARRQAAEGIYYEASTKILLQCRTRFWQKQDNLQGGFSKTNLPIGQLHYPDWEESGISPDERGILVIYTWGQEAEMFGAQPEAEAIENAVQQVATIHPEIREHFEVGAVQAWFNEPSAQGAFVYLRPNQYNDSMYKLLRSEHPIYLAGEGMSWSNGWIQGAMESGLRAAYEFYRYNEKQYPPEHPSTHSSGCSYYECRSECMGREMHLKHGKWPREQRCMHTA